MEYEFYINAPVAGQSLASLPISQIENNDQEEIDLGNTNVIDDNLETNNQTNNQETVPNNVADILTDVEELFN
jgi:hypothetical protein